MSLAQDTKYLALFAWRMLVRYNLSRDPTKLGNVSALVDLHLTPFERDEIVHGIRMQSRSPYEPAARALCDSLVYRDPIAPNEPRASFAPTSLFDNMLAVYKLSPNRPVPRGNHSFSIDTALSVREQLQNEQDFWPAIMTLF